MNGLESLKQKMKDCGKIYAGMVNENTTLESAKSAVGKFDFMFIDFEHGNLCPEMGRPILKVCREADLPVIARVQDCEYHCISKCIDLGADGVMIPRTETLAQVKLAIESMRFFPRGRKGVGGSGLFRKGEKFEEINDNRLLILQIESPLGVATLDAMLTVYGHEVAGVVIGPCDMANMCGFGIDTECKAVYENALKVIDVCKKHHKPSGIYCSYNNMGFLLDAGMSIMWMGGDSPFFSGGEEAMVMQKKRFDEASVTITRPASLG